MLDTPHEQAIDPSTIHLDEIALAVCKATNHDWRFVIGTMPVYEMFGIYAAVQRQRDKLAEAAKDSPIAALALLMM